MRILITALAAIVAVSLPAHADEAAETPSFLNGPIVAQTNEDDRISAHADEAADGVTFINGPLLSQAEEEKPEEISAECQAFRADINANVSDLVRAGCEPTLAQMSKLMDNPLGNVAMLFTQGDWTRLENRKFGKSEDQYLYTGIAQFPKKLSDDWNLINRVVWTVPSAPVNQNRIDDFSGGQVNRLTGQRLTARSLAVHGHVGAVIADDAQQQIDIGQPRHVAQCQLLVGQQRGDHQRQRGVLGARDRDRAGKLLAATNADTVHEGSQFSKVFLRLPAAGNARALSH